MRRWSGKLSLTYCSFNGAQFHGALRARFGLGIPEAVFTYRDGVASGIVNKRLNDRFGEHLVGLAGKDQSFITSLARELRERADEFTALFSVDPSLNWWARFKHSFDRFFAVQIGVNTIVNYLPPDFPGHAERMEELRSARLYAEKVFDQANACLVRVGRKILQDRTLPEELAPALLVGDLDAHFEGGATADEGELRRRYAACALLYEDGAFRVVCGGEVDELEGRLFALPPDGELRGTCAQPGKVRGMVRVVHDPFSPGEFNQGDILVSGMTRPDFVPLMKKAGAIVTDAGGVLCHAAIVSRELGTPCVIGTQTATRVLRSGDLVEVDAAEGVVRKLSRPTESL